MNFITDVISNKFLTGMNITVCFENGENVKMTPMVSTEESANIYTYSSDNVSATIREDFTDGAAVYSISLESNIPLGSRPVIFTYDLSFADNVLSSYLDNPWWTICGFPKTPDEVRDCTQSFLFDVERKYISSLLLCGDVFCAHGFKDGIYLEILCPGYTNLEGPFMSVLCDCDPTDSVTKNYAYAREVGAINVPLRCEREYPELFEDFGWCSWNAFYQDVTAEKLYTKLREFKEKNVPVKWIIIDDGWSLVKDGKLASFDADHEKFPEGLAGCIKRIKEEFGVKAVGVWHTLNGYWQGVAPDSDIAREYADCLITNVAEGRLITSTDPDKAFPFWDAFHSHLAECGVDFVKVDSQSSTYIYLKDTTSLVAGTVGTHEGIEESIIKSFGGMVINCMGMGSANVLSRPFTAISRNSDDFFPDRENGFSKHLRQNLYNALWHTNLYYGDYDMWWSGKSEPVPSGVLRAISGGPVYVSDAVGDTNPENLIPVVGKDGTICRMDNFARPTTDCLFVNCETSPKLQKGYNYKDDAFALALFNVYSEKCDVTDTFTFDVIHGLSHDTDYVAYEYFTKEFARVKADTSVTVSLPFGGVSAYSLYPVMSDDGGEYILLGDTERYFGTATEKKKVYVNELLK